MLQPDQVYEAASQREEEFGRFRIFLKAHADPDEFDAQCKRLHEKFFAEMDCSKCRNCCTKITTTFSVGDVHDAAEHLHIPPEELTDQYLLETDMGYKNTLPCKFLDKDNQCILGDCRPEECKGYPYTDRPERLFSLYGMLDAAFYCPVVYEILNHLMTIYNFRGYERHRQNQRRHHRRRR